MSFVLKNPEIFVIKVNDFFLIKDRKERRI